MRQELKIALYKSDQRQHHINTAACTCRIVSFSFHHQYPAPPRPQKKKKTHHNNNYDKTQRGCFLLNFFNVLNHYFHFKSNVRPLRAHAHRSKSRHPQDAVFFRFEIHFAELSGVFFLTPSVSFRTHRSTLFMTPCKNWRTTDSGPMRA